MKKLFILSGIPGSGKSTLAREIWEKSPKNTIVINNDCIRGMLTSHSEQELNDTYKMGLDNISKHILLAKESLLNTFVVDETVDTIVVDACHFSNESLRIFEKLSNTNIEIFHILLDIEIDKALLNAQKRTRKEDLETILFVKEELSKLNKTYSFVISNYEDKANFFKKYFCK